MRVLIVSKNSFNQVEYNNVSNIAYSAGAYVITSGGATYSYSASDYNISILYEEV